MLFTTLDVSNVIAHQLISWYIFQGEIILLFSFEYLGLVEYYSNDYKVQSTLSSATYLISNTGCYGE